MTPSFEDVNLGAALATWRRNAGLSQQEAADALWDSYRRRVAKGQIGKWENNKNSPNALGLWQLMQIYGVAVEQFSPPPTSLEQRMENLTAELSRRRSSLDDGEAGGTGS